MSNLYANYFNIDPDFTPVVDDKLIEQKPDLWKSYFPHETFINLLKATVRVLTRTEKKSIWVEGAYGSGKSHAVLTMKKLLEANEDDTKSYFEKYNLDKDLLNKFQNLKSSDSKILTVHRYGSASIRNDYQLAIAIQESIEKALKENNIENCSKNALKTDIIKWLEDEKNKNYFNSIISDSQLFAGDTVDNIIDKLKEYSGSDLSLLMDKIFKISEERGINAFKLEIETLVEWIESIIKDNNLKAIIFIWDEFTEYFKNNIRSLSGFQKISEISATSPFYLMIVTHLTGAIFPDTNNDARKIIDRFIRPGEITLPENIAFDLMGHAMKKNSDPTVLKEWNGIVSDLYNATIDTRELVQKRAKISDKQLKNILPIHPYTALLLKHISSAFGSNQRSMFEFIGKNSEDDSKGFQWFIENHGPYDADPFLTVDMLWNYFYEKGRDSLSSEIRSILDCYSPTIAEELRNDQKRVFKTILLLQAISQRVGDTVELFIPNERNIENAFEGSEIVNARSIAEGLVRENIIYTKHLGNNKYQYSVLTSATDTKIIEKHKEEAKQLSTTELVKKSQFLDNIDIKNALKLRFDYNRIASVKDFDSVIRNLKNANVDSNKINAIFTFAKDDDERAEIQQKIYTTLSSGECPKLVFIDTSNITLGSDLYEQFVDNYANSLYQNGKDYAQAKSYSDTAIGYLQQWARTMQNGTMVVSYFNNIDGNRVEGEDELNIALTQIVRDFYPNALEINYTTLPDTMFIANSLALGAQCGAKEETVSQYRSGNVNTKIETALKEVWKVEKYWEKPENQGLLITKIKNVVDKKIQDTFVKENRVSMTQIYDALKDAPFGFLPCNLTAFILGFVLKEYTKGNYIWSDTVTNTELTVDVLKDMISDLLKFEQNPATKYRVSYIATETEEIKYFNNGTSEAFSIPKNICNSVESTRDALRNKMRELAFPIWYLSEILSKQSFKTSQNDIKRIIDLYCLLANNDTADTSDNDIAKQIGTLYIRCPEIISDLQSILTSEICTEAMQEYLNTYEGGILKKLSEAISDNGQYINVLRDRFKASVAANWVWKKETAQEIIDDVILDYKIIQQSNKIIMETNNINDLYQEWCETCDRIKISYFVLKDKVEDLSELLLALYTLKQNKILRVAEKSRFLDLLSENSDKFKEFYNNQVITFKNVYEFLLHGFSDEDIRCLYDQIPQGVYMDDKNSYTQKISSIIEDYKSSLDIQKFKKLWVDQTGTKSPKEWSEKYGMSVLYMFDENQIIMAKNSLDVLNENRPNSERVKVAMEFIEKNNIFESMRNETLRDKIFIKKVIKDYAVILNDISEVKQILRERINEDVYNWVMVQTQIDQIVKDFAQSKYDTTGYNKAIEKIAEMNSEEVKKYLSDLIKDNMTVGIQIIKSNNK